jgi:hypothetical protein
MKTKFPLNPNRIGGIASFEVAYIAGVEFRQRISHPQVSHRFVIKAKPHMSFPTPRSPTPLSQPTLRHPTLLPKLLHLFLSDFDVGVERHVLAVDVVVAVAIHCFLQGSACLSHVAIVVAAGARDEVDQFPGPQGVDTFKFNQIRRNQPNAGQDSLISYQKNYET